MVAVRLPPFWHERHAVWFAQAEAHLTLAGINIERIKFYHVISHLEHRYATKVEDIITSPPERGPYKLLRAELVRRLSSSPEQRIRQLLTVEEIGDRNPFSRLPRNVQSFLAGQNENNLEAASPRSKSSRRSLALINLRTSAHFGRRSLNSPAKWLHSAPDRTSSATASGSPTTC